jgi:hypothetical protein
MAGMSEGGFNPRLVAGIVAAGIAAFAAFMFLLAYADDFRTGRDGRGHPLSVSAVGFSGLVKLLRLNGSEPGLIRDEAERRTANLVVAAIEPQTDADAVERLLTARRDLPTLLVLPKWIVAPSPQRNDWVMGVGVLPGPLAAAPLAKVARVKLERVRVRGRSAATGRAFLNNWDVPLPNRLQAVSGDGLEPLLVGPGGRVVLAQLGHRPVYLLSEPDLLDNMGLQDPARARAALELLEALGSGDSRGTDFDLVINGFGGSRGFIRLAFEPPFLALTLALFVAALLAGLHGAFRFGPAARDARAIALGKAALVETSAGLFRLARREAATGPAYAELIREAAAHASGAGPALQGEALDLYLDRLSPPEAPFSALAERAGAARDRAGLLAAARALFSWKKDLIK